MKTFTASLLALAATASSALAQIEEIPLKIHHQGKIAVDGVNFDGTGQFKFMIYHGDPVAVATPLSRASSRMVNWPSLRDKRACTVSRMRWRRETILSL